MQYSCPINQRLCGSASTVLTATVGDRKMAKFDPLTDSKSLSRLPKNCHRWLGRRGDPLRQIWWRSVYGGFLGRCAFFELSFLFIFGFPDPNLPIQYIVASRKLYTEQANRGRGIQIWGHWQPPIHRSWRCHVTCFEFLGPPRDLLLKFWDSLHISGMVQARNFKYGMQLDWVRFNIPPNTDSLQMVPTKKK